jgi:hypothetical protein
MTERIFEQAVAIAPEHLLHRHRDRRAGFHSPWDEAIAIAMRIPTLPAGSTVELRPVEHTIQP